MNYKVGDRVLCKNTYNWYDKGKYYEIDRVNESTDVSVSNFWFNLFEGYPGVPLFGKYFYTIEEARKLKLEKLDKVWKLLSNCYYEITSINDGANYGDDRIWLISPNIKGDELGYVRRGDELGYVRRKFFNEHFFDLEKLRKLKLERINEL